MAASEPADSSDEEDGEEDDVEYTLPTTPNGVKAAQKKAVHKLTHQDLKKDESGRYLKPDASVGRPGRGGYNIYEIMPWPAQRTKELREAIKAIVASYLDHSLALHLQPEYRCTAALKAVSRVRNYTTLHE